MKTSRQFVSFIDGLTTDTIVIFLLSVFAGFIASKVFHNQIDANLVVSVFCMAMGIHIIAVCFSIHKEYRINDTLILLGELKDGKITQEEFAQLAPATLSELRQINKNFRDRIKVIKESRNEK